MEMRRVPWSELGVDVRGLTTIEDVLDKAALNWKVTPQPIFNAQGDEIPGFIANVRDVDNEVMGIVSPKYEIVQNVDAFDFVANLVGHGFEFEMAGAGRGGKQVWVLGKLPERSVLGDNVNPYICFTNTHDGSSSVKVCMTPVRVICANVLNFAFKEAARTWSARHSSSIQIKLEEAKESIRRAEAYMDVMNDAANKLSGKKFTDGQIEQMFKSIYDIDLNNDSNRKIRNFYDAQEDFFRCYNMDDVKQFKGTAWGVLMAATDYADHRIPNRNTVNYRARNWDNIITGHNFVDAVFKEVA